MAEIQDLVFRVDTSAIDEAVTKLERLSALVKDLKAQGLSIETIESAMGDTYVNVRGEKKDFSGRNVLVDMGDK